MAAISMIVWLVLGFWLVWLVWLVVRVALTGLGIVK